MRNQVMIFLTITFITTLAVATPKDVTAMMSESKTARESLSKEKDSAKKIEKLKAFEKVLNATLQDYEKENPEEGGDAEEKVAKFSYRFEPVFELASKKIAKTECDKTKGRIELEDRSGKAEEADLSDAAKEALKWVDVICAK